MVRTSVRGVVLVHGAYHGAWCWDAVRPLLDLPSVAVDLPGRGRRPAEGVPVTIEMCVDAVLEDADCAGFDQFVLVGHSLGGLTITETANRRPESVGHLVYLTAFAPTPGACLFEVSARLGGIPAGIDPAGVQPLPEPGSAHRRFAGDLDDSAFAAMYDRLVPEPNGLCLASVTGYAPAVPSTYVRCTRDVTVPVAVADDMIRNLRPGAVRDLDSDHDPMLSHPEALAALLNDVAAAAPSPT